MTQRPLHLPAAALENKPISLSVRANALQIQRHRGFTLLEVLTVVGIIAVLTTIVAIAFNVVGNNASAKQTKVVLEACSGLQTEYQNSTSLPPHVKSGRFGVGESPGFVMTTAVFSSKLKKVPKNREALEKMSVGALANLIPPEYSSSATYLAEDMVEFPAGSGIVYQSKVAANSGNNPTGLPTDLFWSTVGLPLQTPVDGWGRPVLVVSGAGLDLTAKYDVVTATNQLKTYIATQRYAAGEAVSDTSAAYKCIKVSTGNPLSDTTHWVQVSPSSTYVKRSPNGRPFWVSAGPDGRFETDDDNVYSFEN